ncbi:MAG: hypothetical protein RML15_07245 [Bacteroidota bacterium]|nr:hypothetical protein [Candidatus Kapabacteria bacterium]MCS7303085.1 hypothetical protein [Candidatus Kapabacteria bacterium]MCX7936672.1 hypothetical protein [Chlorobiota bacterium]MDW8075402.1 hypothetical protein [Bacteroidota bacterium]MDW8272187.1 hypothetical protein [Bacteroidota bacterium]
MNARIHPQIRRRTTLPQIVVFGGLVGIGALAFFEIIAVPVLEAIFRDSLGAKVQCTSRWFEWMLVVNGGGVYQETEAKVYLFNPFLSLLPLIGAAGFGFAAVVSALLPLSVGLVRKNLEREITEALEHLAEREYGVVNASDVAALRARLAEATPEQLSILEEELLVSSDEVLLLQRCVLWMDGGIRRFLHLGSAFRLYLRNHFTIEYEQAVLGSIYVGAAVLIIIIGLRGLQFIPKERPSLVLFAISLEFVLLIAYAVTLMFSRPEEVAPSNKAEMETLFGFSNATSSPLASVRYAEKLLRMFIALPPPVPPNASVESSPEQSH